MTPLPSEPDAALDVLRHAWAGMRPGSLLAVATVPDGSGLGLALGARTWAFTGDRNALVRRVAGELTPRWVWWSAAATATDLAAAGVRLVGCWDVAAVHRLLHGGAQDDPALVWATQRSLPLDGLPVSGQLDLLATTAGAGEGDPEQPVRPDGYLRAEWAADGPASAERAAAWAALALRTAEEQQVKLGELTDRRRVPRDPALPVLTAWSESAAALLCVDLATTGLPLDRETATRLIARHAGERPVDDDAAARSRGARDEAVHSHVPGETVDLRNPGQVRAMLARVGIDVPDTRSWRLEPLRGTHPVVDALLAWRKSERVATTYGYSWLDRHVGADGRLRGAWQGSDGAAGRMTAQAGLHNLPAELREAVAAQPGHVFVRADLGQIEPRVLAAVSADPALAAATADADLYAPVASRLGCDRPTAKVAVLAAMYGQTSGTAGQALRGLERAYPVAMDYLRSGDTDGQAGRAVRTYGGRLVRMYPVAAEDRSAIAGRGRFARNALVQGAAAELFKMWAVTVRAALAATDPPMGEIVLCLHDELLVHAPEAQGDVVTRILHESLDQAAARWAAGSGVRFVADVAVLSRWSEAKP